MWVNLAIRWWTDEMGDNFRIMILKMIYFDNGGEGYGENELGLTMEVEDQLWYKCEHLKLYNKLRYINENKWSN